MIDQAKLEHYLGELRCLKADIPEGPWTREPDRLEFRHAGLPCLLQRAQLLHWCGYVGIPPGHPLHGVHYDAAGVDAHGGLTYADGCGHFVCHVPEAGEPDQLWWFGFDCAHSGDLTPYVMKYRSRLEHAGKRSLRNYETYKDVAYVEAEVRHLAEQLAALGRAR